MSPRLLGTTNSGSLACLMGDLAMKSVSALRFVGEIKFLEGEVVGVVSSFLTSTGIRGFFVGERILANCVISKDLGILLF